MAGTDLIAGIASRVAETQGLRLVAGSNVTPEITLYDSADTGASLLDLLGVRTYARIEDRSGRVVAAYGNTEPINLALAAIFWGAAAFGIFLLLRGLKK